jgi:hypothetical protein
MGVIINYNQILASTVNKKKETMNIKHVHLIKGSKSVLDFWYAWNHFKWK